MKKHNKIALFLIIVLIMPIILSVNVFADTGEVISPRYLRFGDVKYTAYKKGYISHIANSYNQIYMQGSFNGSTYFYEHSDVYCDVVYQYDVYVEKTGRYNIEFYYQSTNNTNKVKLLIVTKDGVSSGEIIYEIEDLITEKCKYNETVQLREGITYTVALLIRMSKENTTFYQVQNSYIAEIKYNEMVYDEEPPEGEPDPIYEDKDNINCDLWLEKIDEQGRCWYRYIGDLDIFNPMGGDIKIMNDTYEVELVSRWSSAGEVVLNMYLDKIKAPISGTYYPNLYILGIIFDNDLAISGKKEENKYILWGLHVDVYNPEDLIEDFVFKDEMPNYGLEFSGDIIEDGDYDEFMISPWLSDLIIKFIPYVIVEPIEPVEIGKVYEREKIISGIEDGYTTHNIIRYDAENNCYVVYIYDESTETIESYILTSIEFDRFNNNVYFNTEDGVGTIIYTDESIIIIYTVAGETKVYEYQLGTSMSGKVKEYKEEYEDDEYYYIDGVNPRDDDDDDDEPFNLWKWLSEQVFGGIGELIDAIIGWIANAITFMVNIVENVIKKMFNFVTETVGGLLSGVDDVFDFFTSGIGDFINGNWGERYG